MTACLAWRPRVASLASEACWLGIHRLLGIGASLITLAATPADPIAAIELGEKSKSPHPSSGSLGTVHRPFAQSGLLGPPSRERHGASGRRDMGKQQTETVLPPPAGRFCVTVVAAVEVALSACRHPISTVSVSVSVLADISLCPLGFGICHRPSGSFSPLRANARDRQNGTTQRGRKEEKRPQTTNANCLEAASPSPPIRPRPKHPAC